MIKSITIGILCLFLSSSLFGQNWKPISTTAITNYQMSQPLHDALTVYHKSPVITGQMDIPYMALVIDSSNYINGDSIFYLRLNTFESGQYVYVDQPSFLEKQMVQAANGVYHFYDPDSFNIHTHANVNDTWIFNNQLQDTATVVAIIEDTVLGHLDSIKIIELSSGDSILLSKNYGIVSFPDTNNQSFNLVGIEYDSVNHNGLMLPKAINTFDFEVGDVFYKHKFWNHFAIVNTYTKAVVKTKQIINGSYFYEVDVTGIEFGQSGPTTIDTNYINTTTTWVHNQNYPNAWTYSPTGTLTRVTVIHYRNIVRRDASNRLFHYTALHYPGAIVSPNVHWNTGNFTGWQPGGNPMVITSPNLGYVYTSTQGMQYNEHTILMGYIKNGVFVGDTSSFPSLTVNIPLIHNQPLEINVLSNPVHSDLNLSFSQVPNTSSNIQLKLFNIQGQVVKYEEHPVAQELSVDVRTLDQGLYFLEVALDGTKTTRRIVITR